MGKILTLKCAVKTLVDAGYDARESTKVFNCVAIYFGDMPSGERYEDTYGMYLKLFEVVSRIRIGIAVSVYYPPASWVALLHYLRCLIVGSVEYFKEDGLPNITYNGINCRISEVLSFMTRSDIDAMCGFRPETADALWKVDNQWFSGRRRLDLCHEKEFVVANKSSLSRPEILVYRETLKHYVPKKRKVVLVPCAADKPYPSVLHKQVQEILDRLGVADGYYICVVTGVLGLVPEELWDIAPYYDTGVPNRWEVLQACKEYFLRNNHDTIIGYMDFYSEAADIGLKIAGKRADFITEPGYYYDYMDLSSEDNLQQLEDKIKQLESEQ